MAAGGEGEGFAGAEVYLIEVNFEAVFFEDVGSVIVEAYAGPAGDEQEIEG